MKLWDYARYHFARIDFSLTADVHFTNHKKHSPEQIADSLKELDLKLKNVSGLAVKLGIITPEKEEGFRSDLYKNAEEIYTPRS